MTRQEVTLNDRYDLSKRQVLLNGTQALVRLMLIQKARDEAAGLNTAGYVTGYRGSPLGAVDMQMERAEKQLTEADVTFQRGLNEDLAATALWGSQQAELRGEGSYDGVFGLWYGKGPGVDRSGDVMRHANMAGTSPAGGVIMAMGDDHTGESSTTLHQSDWAMVDAYMPIVSPAGVQEILDMGQYAWALSRFAGVWVGLKTMKDTIEVTSVVDGDPFVQNFVTPDFEMPDGGLNIRLIDTPVEQEARIIDHKRFAAEAFARANKIDKVGWPNKGAKIGLVAAGKNWLDLQHAMSLLGIDEAEAERLGITTYKVGQVWPLDMESFHEWAEGLDLIISVEEKRKLIEVQIKEAIFDDHDGRRVYGWHKGDHRKEGRREEFFPTRFALDPIFIAEKIGEVLIEEGCGSEKIEGGLAKLAEAKRADNAEEIAARLPYFCSGCPHNSSTKVPDGSRAYAGIGCHYMVQWMDRDTVGFTQMGGEGANWVGEAPFSNRGHVFQNLGDGTYNHSGVQAIRFALMAGTTMTYKILYNDAVAMTGGQGNDGGLTHDQICQEVLAMGVKTVHLVHDPAEGADLSNVPSAVKISTRDQLESVQIELSEVKGVSVLVYVQTCAAEKRRRRKRGLFPDPDKRVFINTDVCEGCGDCGLQSNCVSIVPVETELGRKRAIDQSSCNKDFSCVNGFCPSFVTVEGAQLKTAATNSIALPNMSDPALPTINGTHNVVITGVGGTGVVTIGAVLAMAAHVDGKAAGMMEMAGLAQKGGAVHIHCRIAENACDINAIRVSTGECDALIGGDLVVSAGSKTLGLMSTGRTRGVVNAHEIITGDFTRDISFKLPADRLTLALEARLQNGLSMFDASELAKALMGEAIYSNMMVFGAAWQMGAIPVSGASIRKAIELNGTAVKRNLQAFEYGRWAVLHPADAAKVLSSDVVELPKSAEEKIAFRATHLTAYQNADYAKRYTDFVARFEGDLRDAVALGYYKVLSYKDEYEVARLLIGTKKKAQATFDGDLKLTHHLAPPMLGGTGADGRPKKRAMPRFTAKLFPLLARLKGVRGTAWDVFGRTEERKMERALIKQYEADMEEVHKLVRPDTLEAAIALAKLPLDNRGFGPVKQANVAKTAKRREELLTVLRESQKRSAAE
ncbi:indolepyruvate ferredoxin oxidoreductase [Octadecabacter temperatus]|uniref:Indolepyruvate ferredoxin oxidoreductase n=1 Tax=Octadecabacter temperatus TaxID=1458307 RepID=A0A0K0Y5Y1_9RHOB|nr:indolepyruvate ferredoxin oxidoreductase family protein [Octadecabacter temperatus]AKS46227.1 indolepyruvate ferredoxin oxidoreductase [Octadecabacter temperatus]SIO10072.1 indolepyruvate ferredoxin oxidoreductase [Octadecabacter temperatus]